VKPENPPGEPRAGSGWTSGEVSPGTAPPYLPWILVIQESGASLSQALGSLELCGSELGLSTEVVDRCYSNVLRPALRLQTSHFSSSLSVPTSEMGILSLVNAHLA
jgi:hypothetical protein